MMMQPSLVMVGISLIAYEGRQQFFEVQERRKVFHQARVYADSLNLPLLVVGAPKFSFTHPCGDVTIDISPSIPATCEYEIADIRDIPYPDGYFGASYVSHVLEHLPTVDDAHRALDELHRVSGKVFIVSPHKSSLFAQLHPGHHVWVTSSGAGYIIEQRGLGGAAREEDYITSLLIVLG